jgi:hypothetical protein
LKGRSLGLHGYDNQDDDEGDDFLESLYRQNMRERRFATLSDEDDVFAGPVKVPRRDAISKTAAGRPKRLTLIDLSTNTKLKQENAMVAKEPRKSTNSLKPEVMDALFSSSPIAQSTPRLRLEPAIDENGKQYLMKVPAQTRSVFDPAHIKSNTVVRNGRSLSLKLAPGHRNKPLPLNPDEIEARTKQAGGRIQAIRRTSETSSGSPKSFSFHRSSKSVVLRRSEDIKDEHGQRLLSPKSEGAARLPRARTAYDLKRISKSEDESLQQLSSESTTIIKDAVRKTTSQNLAATLAASPRSRTKPQKKYSRRSYSVLQSSTSVVEEPPEAWMDESSIDPLQSDDPRYRV